MQVIHSKIEEKARYRPSLFGFVRPHLVGLGHAWVRLDLAFPPQSSSSESASTGYFNQSIKTTFVLIADMSTTEIMPIHSACRLTRRFAIIPFITPAIRTKVVLQLFPDLL